LPASSQHLGYIWSAVLLDDGNLASAGRDQTIRIHSPESPELKELQVLHGHKSSVSCLAEARSALWSGDRSGMLRRWILDGDRFRLDAQGTAHAGATLCLLKVRGARFVECVASGGADGAIRFFQDTPVPIYELRAHRGWIWALATAGEILYS